MKKICSRCKEEKNLDQFGKDRYSKDGHRYHCKECHNSKQREYARNNKELIKARNAKKAASRKAYYQSERGIESSRRSHLKRKYGITLEQYNELLSSQDGKCAICNEDEKCSRNSVLAVDHCHKTGEIRGLLCSHCNRGLGLFKDNSEILTKAIKYINYGI